MLKEKINRMEKTIGMYVQLSDISISKIAGLAGYDFVWVDNEHSYMTTETLLGHIMALNSVSTSTVVRVPQDNLTAVKHVLEMGVDGIIFPMIKTAEEANRLIEATLYPPFGTRGFGPMNANNYGFKNAMNYCRESNRNLCRFIQLENKEAIENLEQIIQNPYIDGYIFGPNDLSGSYNMLGDVFSEKITDIITDAIDFLHKNKKYVGIASGGYSEEILRHWSDLGADMLIGGADFDFLRDSALKNRKNLEKIHKIK